MQTSNSCSEWLRVTRETPCKVCGKPDWCTFTADGRVACCMRIESDRPMRNGGWAHALNVDCGLRNAERQRPRPPRQKIAGRRSTSDLEAMLGCWEKWASTGNDHIRDFAARLNVSVDSLRMLGATWSPKYKAWAFPMRDAARQVIGIRLRANDGFKWAVKHCQNGLFWPLGVPGELCDTIYLCEGPTDTAALISLELAAIGRPNCSACVGMLKDAMGRIGMRDVVIVSDKDTPGRMGARRLAKELLRVARTVRIIEPLQGKDVREWVASGATRQVIETVARNAEVVR